MNKTRAIYILYHDNCMDGFGSAFVAWLKFKDSVSYIPVQYGDTPSGISELSHIYVLDFCFPPDILQQWLDMGCYVTIIDHHKTAQKDLESFRHPNAEIIFDMDESGATLTWKYFFHHKSPPRLLQYIKDRDLWKWELVGTKEISMVLWGLNKDFVTWETVCDKLEDTLELNKYIQQGQAILLYVDRLVEGIAKKATPTMMWGYPTLLVNTPVLISEVGTYLLALNSEIPFAISYFDVAEKRHWSLRSVGDFFDVSTLAKQMGGGGHKNAAGFSTEIGWQGFSKWEQ